MEHGEPAHTVPSDKEHSAESYQNEASHGSDEDMQALLSAITEEAQREATGARQGIIAEFAGRMAHARKQLSGRDLAAALYVLKQERRAALAMLEQRHREVVEGRRKAALLRLRSRTVVSGRLTPYFPKG